MPKLNMDALIKRLRQHVARLHEIYVDCSNIGLSDRLMEQIVLIEASIVELRSLT